MKSANLSQLLIDRMKKLVSSEQQQLEALNELVTAANTPSLKAVMSAYCAGKELNIKRLKKGLAQLMATSNPHTCKVVPALVSDCYDAIAEASATSVSDAALITTLQQINHLNIVNYGTAASFARTMKRFDVSQLMHNALDDERKMDERLTGIAEEIVNPSAAELSI